ncbi:MAG: DUF1211 domain-containing protein [Planctomyces sp.]|nr:DUF1211 domain-containing protein [Planctomyces sp.]
MSKSRIEAFSDGVIAILITIMVFEIKAPEGADLAALMTVAPSLLTFLLSFLYLGIYWNNHHHMLQLTKRINGAVLWANLHLLFWLSLLPFVTGWLNRSELSRLPVALYGVVLLFAAIAYTILQSTIIKAEGKDSRLKVAIGPDLKGKISLAAYVAGLLIAWQLPIASIVIYSMVALMWFIPDKRIEREIELM